MATFDYHPVASLEEALELLGRYGDEAHLMAGGTALVILMKLGMLEPGHVIGLRGVETLRGVVAGDDGSLEIRSLTTHRQAERAPDTAAYCPALAETFSRVATVRIRNQATVGGNLAHADPAQDPPPMLLALGGEAVVAGPAGRRAVPLDEFFLGFFETVLAPDEVLVSVRLPPLAPGTRAGYLKFLPRTEDDYATVSVAAALRVVDGVCEEARIGLGALATVPLRGRAVEDALRGQRLTPAVVEEAAALVSGEVDPLDDARGSAGYKREMARVCTRRVLEQLVEQDAVAQ